MIDDELALIMILVKVLERERRRFGKTERRKFGVERKINKAKSRNLARYLRAMTTKDTSKLPLPTQHLAPKQYYP